MAQYDVYLNHAGGYLLDCQAGMFSDLNTRFTVPLLPEAMAPTPGRRLNPIFVIDGESHAMITQYAGAVEVRELGPRVASLEGFNYEISNALDLLLTGV
jgi:toxin CcdB